MEQAEGFTASVGFLFENHPSNFVFVFQCFSIFVFANFTKKLSAQVWRMRVYSSDKTVAAAKPLWFLVGDLSMAKDEVKRIV